VVPEFPATLPPIYFASLWDLEDAGNDPFTISLALVSPEGRETTLGMQEITPTGTMLHKMNFQLPGLKVEGEGKHVLAVAVKTDGDREIRARLPLYVFRSQDR
jgi:hypothetical protein